MPPKSPAEVLFSAYHRRILALVLLRPEQSFHVRAIARLAGVPAGSLHRELKLLAESGLLRCASRPGIRCFTAPIAIARYLRNWRFLSQDQRP